MVNGTEQTPTDGIFSFTLDSDATVTLESLAGITDVASDNQETVVYNLQGIRVAKGATADCIRNLPSGIYIINGKKRMIQR